MRCYVSTGWGASVPHGVRVTLSFALRLFQKRVSASRGGQRCFLHGLRLCFLIRLRCDISSSAAHVRACACVGASSGRGAGSIDLEFGSGRLFLRARDGRPQGAHARGRGSRCRGSPPACSGEPPCGPSCQGARRQGSRGRSGEADRRGGHADEGRTRRGGDHWQLRPGDRAVRKAIRRGETPHLLRPRTGRGGALPDRSSQQGRGRDRAHAEGCALRGPRSRAGSTNELTHAKGSTLSGMARGSSRTAWGPAVAGRSSNDAPSSARSSMRNVAACATPPTESASRCLSAATMRVDPPCRTNAATGIFAPRNGWGTKWTIR